MTQTERLVVGKASTELDLSPRGPRIQPHFAHHPAGVVPGLSPCPQSFPALPQGRTQSGECIPLHSRHMRETHQQLLLTSQEELSIFQQGLPKNSQKHRGETQTWSSSRPRKQRFSISVARGDQCGITLAPAKKALSYPVPLFFPAPQPLTFYIRDARGTLMSEELGNGEKGWTHLSYLSKVSYNSRFELDEGRSFVKLHTTRTF